MRGANHSFLLNDCVWKECLCMWDLGRLQWISKRAEWY